MDKELTGKTALITGASRGIGAATALTLARNGVSRFLLHYNSNREGIEETLAAVRGEGAQAEAIRAELSEAAGIREFIKQVNAPIDILVNNAGSLVKRAKLLEYTEELFDQVVNLNVKSAWMITQAVAPSMIARGGGVVVNLSSIAARNGGGPGATIYAATKYGYPLSTTHVISGAVLGAGATQRLSAVRWGVAGNIVVAWMLTIPAAAAVAAAFYWPIQGIF